MILSFSIIQAKPFDYSLFKDIQPGITKTKLINILKENNYSFIEKNNDAGGKYLVAKIDFSIDGIALDTMRIGFKNKKVESVLFAVNRNLLYKLKLKYDIEANCKLVSDETASTYYYFDNGMLCVNMDVEYIFFNSMTYKCDD